MREEEIINSLVPNEEGKCWKRCIEEKREYSWAMWRKMNNMDERCVPREEKSFFRAGAWRLK